MSSPNGQPVPSVPPVSGWRKPVSATVAAAPTARRSNPRRTVREAESEPIRVSLATSAGQALVRVQNHGAVIPEHDLERVFEKYYRGTGTGNTRGAGLGLYLVRRIVEQFGGSVTLESSASGGTRATVGLSLA